VLEGIADYRFVESLGPGNYGAYFLATCPERLPVDAEYVVVKVLARPVGDDGFKRAVRELQSFAAAKSPYLVALYDAGQDGGAFYYAMEHLALGSLAKPAAPVTEAHATRAVEHVARAAHALHESGLVHRDIRPANVWLTPDGGKLSDLGLTQVLAPELTMTSMGAPASVEFVDPALLLGAHASRASDIWSLGATLHWAVAGEGFYGAVPDNEPLLAMRRILSSTPTISPALDPELAALVTRCIAKEVADRPRTADEVADAIAAVG
jgi:eukaryotic-like serine/threonine-protein kinase